MYRTPSGLWLSLLLFATCVSTGLLAQPVNSVATRTASVALSLQPLKVLGTQPHLSIGTRVGRRRTQGLLDLSVGRGPLTLWGHSLQDYALYAVTLEGRYELNPEEYRGIGGLRTYLGLRLGGLYTEQLRESNSFPAVNGEQVGFDRARRSIRRFEALPVFTLVRPLGRRWELEAYVGAGIAYRRVRYTEVINPRTLPDFDLATAITFGLPLLVDEPAEGRRLLPAARAGVRVVYLLTPLR